MTVELLGVEVRIAGDRWSVPMARVREIVRVGAITPIPRVPARIRGVASLRGRVVPVIDPALVLGGAPGTLDEPARLVVVDAPPIVAGRDRLVALLVAGIAGLGATTAPPLALEPLLEAP